MTAQPPPPGWYTDDGDLVQWWDGSRWTGQYLHEQPDTGALVASSAPSVGRRVVTAVASVAALVLLGAGLLLWLGRGDRVADLSVAMVGPFIGVVIGSTISTRRSRAKVPKPRPVWWYVAMFAVLNVLWLVFVAGANGGLDGDGVLPVVVLTVVGTAVMTGGSRVTSPEFFR